VNSELPTLIKIGPSSPPPPPPLNLSGVVVYRDTFEESAVIYIRGKGCVLHGIQAFLLNFRMGGGLADPTAGVGGCGECGTV